jgi:hypothetical protein
VTSLNSAKPPAAAEDPNKPRVQFTLNKVICGSFDPLDAPFWTITDFLLDAEECYSQIVGNALRGVPGPSGKSFVFGFMMSRVKNECVFTFLSVYGES